LNSTVHQIKPHQIEAWLNELGLPSADRDYKPGHERVCELLDAITHQGFIFKRPKLRVRVAGTNGKGSTAHYLAAALRASGLKIGLYTSPHILRFNERIQIDGVQISIDNLLSYMEVVMPLALKVNTSYFETATVLALMAFSDASVDVEILEAGVGARLDATTAVEADMGLLTPVALDHQDWLGSDIQQIAIEKSYVFQGCKKALSAEQNEVVTTILNDCHPCISYAGDFGKQLLMLGQHQQQNAGLAMVAMQEILSLGLHVDLVAAEAAIKETIVAGRLEHIKFAKHDFWMDAAHNEHAIEKLFPTLKAFKEPFDVIFLCTRKDRDLTNCIPLLLPLANKVIIMTGDGDYEYQTMEEALESELSHVHAGRFLVLGSFVTLGETINWMEKKGWHFHSQ